MARWPGLDIDNHGVRAAQIRRLATVRHRRDPQAVIKALAALAEVARTGTGNLLEAAAEAARHRATVGEISDALRAEFGDHSARPKVVTDIYRPAFGEGPEVEILAGRIADFTARRGAKPGILVTKLGRDGHDCGSRVVASAFTDMGFDVVAGPLFQTPEEAADLALIEKVDVVGGSSRAAGHKTLLPQLSENLELRGAADIAVVCGGVIPRQDYDFLCEAGVSAVFGPGTPVLDAARTVLDLLEGRLRN